MSLPSLHQKFTQALLWNALEAIPYQLILVVHNMVLFATIGAQSYGVLGTLFSFIFLAVGLANLGFDAALPLFFADAQKSKLWYKKIIAYQYAPTLCALVIASWLVPLMIKVTNFCRISLSFALIIAALILIEGIKKGARTLLHGAFYNQQTAVIELFQAVMYVLLVWIGYWIGVPLDGTLVCGTLLCVSTTCLAMLGYYLVHFYHSLPSEVATASPMVCSSMRQRCYTIGSSWSHQFFSSNALVPLFAYKFGLTTAGTLKLVSTIAYGAIICIQKIFYSTSDALFAQIKYGNLQDKQEAFWLVTRYLHATLYGIILFGIIVMIWLYNSDNSIVYDTSFSYALLFFILSVSEQFFSTYERFFITQQCAGKLMLFTALMILSLYGIIWYVPANHPVMMLQLVLLVRVFSGILVSGFAWLRWAICPPLQVNLLYLMSSLVISFICFLIAR